jgi:hypothetical protein
VLETEIVVLNFDIEERQDELQGAHENVSLMHRIAEATRDRRAHLVADVLPDNARHLIAVELNDGVRDLDLLERSHGDWRKEEEEVEEGGVSALEQNG